MALESKLWGWKLKEQVSHVVASMFFDLLHIELSKRDAVLVCWYAHRRRLVSVLDAVRSAAACGDNAILTILLSAGVDPNGVAPDRCWYPNLPIHAAAKFGHRDSIDLLLSAKAEVDKAGTDGWTALTYAMVSNQTQTIDMLSHRGASLLSPGCLDCADCLEKERLKDQAFFSSEDSSDQLSPAARGVNTCECFQGVTSAARICWLQLSSCVDQLRLS